MHGSWRNAVLRSTWAAGAGASIILAVLTCILTPAAAHAQRGKPAPEFTRQGLLITNFTAQSEGVSVDDIIGRLLKAVAKNQAA